MQKKFLTLAVALILVFAGNTLVNTSANAGFLDTLKKHGSTLKNFVSGKVAEHANTVKSGLTSLGEKAKGVLPSSLHGAVDGLVKLGHGAIDNHVAAHNAAQAKIPDNNEKAIRELADKTHKAIDATGKETADKINTVGQNNSTAQNK